MPVITKYSGSALVLWRLRWQMDVLLQDNTWKMAQDNRTTLFHSVIWPNILDLPKNKKKQKVTTYKFQIST